MSCTPDNQFRNHPTLLRCMSSGVGPFCDIATCKLWRAVRCEICYIVTYPA